MIFHDLKIGPSSFVETATKYWEGCSVTGLGLSGEGSELFWHMFWGYPREYFLASWMAGPERLLLLARHQRGCHLPKNPSRRKSSSLKAATPALLPLP